MAKSLLTPKADHTSMLFGQKHQFAIEAMVEPYLTPPSSVWGRMRIWCSGEPFGDYANEHCGLPAAHLQNLAHDLPSLWYPDFDELTDADLFRHFDQLLYGYVDGVEIPDNRTFEQCALDGERYGRFIFLNNWGEMFDNEGKFFIFCPKKDLVKVLYDASSGAPCPALTTSIESVQEACSEFSIWFKEQTNRLRLNGFAEFRP